MASKRPRCANCETPFTPFAIGKTRAVSSFCTVSCGAEFAERVLRSEPAVANILIPDDPLAQRRTLALGCGKLVWVPGTDEPDGELGGHWTACTNGNHCTGPHAPHPRSS